MTPTPKEYAVTRPGSCSWCGCVGYHAEVCKGFTVNDPGRPVRAHRPDPRRVHSRCRVDCTCGWRGPLVSTFGEGQGAWVEHWREAG